MRIENGTNVGKWCLEMVAHKSYDGAVVANSVTMKARISTTIISRDSNSDKINKQGYMRKKIVSVDSHKIF